jgi:hypothetical protein
LGYEVKGQSLGGVGPDIQIDISGLSHALCETGLYHITAIWNKGAMARFGSGLTGGLLLIMLPGALGAQSGEFQVVANDLKYGGAVEIILQFVERCDGCIVNATAAYAADMVVFFGNAVEPFHGAGELETLDFAQFTKHIEVSINGAQTDPGQPFSDPLVNFIGGWMVVGSADFFQNDPSLSGHPCFFINFHAHDLRKKVCSFPKMKSSTCQGEPFPVAVRSTIIAAGPDSVPGRIHGLQIRFIRARIRAQHPGGQG